MYTTRHIMRGWFNPGYTKSIHPFRYKSGAFNTVKISVPVHVQRSVAQITNIQILEPQFFESHNIKEKSDLTPGSTELTLTISVNSQNTRKLDESDTSPYSLMVQEPELPNLTNKLQQFNLGASNCKMTPQDILQPESTSNLDTRHKEQGIADLVLSLRISLLNSQD